MIQVTEMLLNAAETKGDFIAVKDSYKSLTYKELLAGAYKLSRKIEAAVPGRKHLALIVTTKAVESVTAVWGVVCSGNYYTAADSKIPLERFNRIIEKMNPSLIIYTEEKQMERLKTDRVSVLVPEKYDGAEKYSLQEIREQIAAHHIISYDPLYMVFTSGSTGEPKAIIKNHQSVIGFAESFVSEFGFNALRHEVFGNQANFDFDVAAKDIYICAYLGATLCLIPGSCFLAPGKLAPFLKENQITVLIWAASAVKLVKRFDCFKAVQPESIRKVFFSGESMTGECIGYWKANLPETEFVNLYAPSEVTGNCLYHIASGENYPGILPLDRVFPNVEVLVLDEEGKPVGEGEKGEIYVRGCFLSQGYYKDEKQTGRRFVQNPLHRLFPDIVYKTGDYVIKRGDRLYFAGRTDNQIKHMGHRIELEEIEANCYTVSDCGNLCVIYDDEKEKLILFTDEKNLFYEKLVAGLKQRLPKYMIPQKIIYVEDLPYNDRGKINRQKVKEMYEVVGNA